MLFFRGEMPEKWRTLWEGEKRRVLAKRARPFLPPTRTGKGGEKTLAFLAGVCYNEFDKTRQAFFEGDLLCLLSVT